MGEMNGEMVKWFMVRAKRIGDMVKWLLGLDRAKLIGEMVKWLMGLDMGPN